MALAPLAMVPRVQVLGLALVQVPTVVVIAEFSVIPGGERFFQGDGVGRGGSVVEDGDGIGGAAAEEYGATHTGSDTDIRAGGVDRNGAK